MGVCCIYLREYDMVSSLMICACIYMYMCDCVVSLTSYMCYIEECVCVCVQAVEKFSEAVKLSPQTLSFIQLGRVHLLREEVEKASEVYKTAIEWVFDSHPVLLCWPVWTPLHYYCILCSTADIIQRILTCQPLWDSSTWRYMHDMGDSLMCVMIT